MIDKQVNISVGNQRFTKNWRVESISVSQLYMRLSRPIVSTETHAEYMKLSKKQKDALKDVGGFVGGTLNSPQRKNEYMVSRDLITLDFDNIPGWQSDAITARCEALMCNYCIYSTRKHTPALPRLRIVIPLDRSITVEEYQPIARRVAQQIGIEMADKTTFDVCRLMYWPSCCADVEFYFRCNQDKPFLSADAVLGTYADWHDMQSWPQVPGEATVHQSMAVKQGDPLTKEGIVGAFCRTYSIEDAMTEFLPGIYEPVDGSADRYTYMNGSTTGGAIVYDGKFLYSHHATDPCGDKLVNAFDMVRLHKFNDLDAEAEPGTPVTKLPSFQQMCEFARKDKACRATLNKERADSVAKDFGEVAAAETSDSLEWMDELEFKDASDIIKNTINNYHIILHHDPSLTGKMAYNDFAGRAEVLEPLPWDPNTGRRMWKDSDSNGLYWYMERSYGSAGRGNIDSAFSMYLAENSFNEVKDYIRELSWDGVPRLDTLFIDFLAAEDSVYTRAVTRKIFVAGIARAEEPGVKFDNMVILCGPQGIGKSTLLSKMAKGWFNDSITSFEGKDAAELLQGIWLVEISELEAFRKSEMSRIKQFLSLNSDIFRAAYARNPEERKRRCIFFGTTNTSEFLRDPTGERRFWPVDVGQTKSRLSVFRELTNDYIDQVWAEARARWIMGEPLHLSEELEALAAEKQLEHKESSAREGLIREFIDRKVPADWQKWSIDKRRIFWGSQLTGNQEQEGLILRDRICAIEIWCECFGGDIKAMKQTDVREINSVLEKLPDWERQKNAVRCGPYDRQRGYMRKY